MHLLYAIGKGVFIDLPLLIFDGITYAYEVQDKRRSLPFPILISKIIKIYGVVLESCDTYSTPMMKLINDGTFNKSLGHAKVYQPSKKVIQPLSQVEH